MSYKQVLDNYPEALRWSFGDSPELADELLQLVREGHKTATCSEYHAFKSEQAPQVGDYSIVLDGAGQPSCVIRTRSFWRQAHQGVFERGGTFAPDMLLVFEVFELIEVF
ncbi:ASCH domain-containing protein [Dickeya undicola]|uniref:ASCH domain-containing protein n=1 Tax=Dickeya undicola TaxID=1577887 RepID=UPI003F296D40